MKIFAYILGTIAVLSLVIWAITGFNKSTAKVTTYAANDPNAPHAQVSEAKFDFGNISLNDKPTHNFTIKNSGKSPLMITDVMTSCHCTSAIVKIPGSANSPEIGMSHEDWQGTLEPDKTATIEVIYSPQIMPVKGEVSRVVTLSTNDPQKGQIQLEVLANVN